MRSEALLPCRIPACMTRTTATYCCLPNSGRCGQSQDRDLIDSPLAERLYPAEWMSPTPRCRRGRHGSLLHGRAATARCGSLLQVQLATARSLRRYLRPATAGSLRPAAAGSLRLLRPATAGSTTHYGRIATPATPRYGRVATPAAPRYGRVYDPLRPGRYACYAPLPPDRYACCAQLLCFSQKLDPQHPLQHH